MGRSQEQRNIHILRFMKKKKSLFKNYIYNASYQLLGIITPLVTSPYISRVLGADNIGIYSFTYSVVYYFGIAASLGIDVYGNRSIAKCRDQEERNNVFSSIYILHLILSIISIIVYVTYLLTIGEQYAPISYIQAIYLVAVCFDINWLFAGIEEFKITVTRSAIVKLITTVLIFCVVRSESDLWKYTFLLTLGQFFGMICVWIFAFRFVRFVKVTWKDIISHLKPLFILAISVLAVAVYLHIDKIMLGVLSSITEVGYYENAFKAIDFPLNLILAFGTVMIPRASSMINNDQILELKELINKSMKVIALVSTPMAFGFAAISRVFSVVFWGIDFEPCGEIIAILAVVSVLITWNNIIRTQFLVPKEKDKGYVIAVCVGAVVDLILNFIFIPVLGGKGAAIGTVGAYTTVFLIQNRLVSEELPICRYLGYYLPYVIFSAIMLITVSFLDGVLPTTILSLFIEIACGCIIYIPLALTWIYFIKKDSLIIEMIGSAKEKIRGKKKALHTSK